jgi:hypothetical protein
LFFSDKNIDIQNQINSAMDSKSVCSNMSEIDNIIGLYERLNKIKQYSKEDAAMHEQMIILKNGSNVLCETFFARRRRSIRAMNACNYLLSAYKIRCFIGVASNIKEYGLIKGCSASILIPAEDIAFVFNCVKWIAGWVGSIFVTLLGIYANDRAFGRTLFKIFFLFMIIAACIITWIVHEILVYVL